jgi:hypothetical protein
MVRGVGFFRIVMVLGALAGGAGASAQETGSRRFAFDTVIGVQDIFAETRDWPTAIVFDPFVSAEIRPNLHVSVRPKFWRLNGEWETVLDQAALQYTFQRGSNWRVEAGRFPSPIGIGMTENRSSINPGVLWWHRPYYMPLPSLGPGAPMVSLVAATYPSGALLATSGDRWDARAALVDTAPVQFWKGDARASRRLNVIAGGGMTPTQGVRGGVAGAWGDLTDAPSGRYQMLNAEGEFAFGYTKLSGEWTRDRFDVTSGTHVARGWTVQIQQTLTPRLFAHSRATMIDAPEVTAAGTVRRTFRSVDTTFGIRVDNEITLKLGHSAVRTWNASAIDHQAGLSLMWTRRWW